LIERSEITSVLSVRIIQPALPDEFRLLIGEIAIKLSPQGKRALQFGERPGIEVVFWGMFYLQYGERIYQFNDRQRDLKHVKSPSSPIPNTVD